MPLNCPMPKLGFDIITLGHGSGGLLTNELLNSSVFNLFSNDILNQKDDAALIKLETNQLVFSTDSFIVSPIFFPGGNIGDLCVNGTVNDLAMCGGVPKHISLGFIIEEGLEMKSFWEILVSIKNACEKAGVNIVTGDTKVVEKGKGDKIFINTSGIGTLNPKSRVNAKNIQVSDKVIVSGQIGNHGMAIMSVREGLEFQSRIKSDTTNLNHVVFDLVEMFGDKIHFLTDPTRGGISSALIEVSANQKFGIEISQACLPINNEVENACELLGLDPLYIANEGIFVAFVDGKYEKQVVSFLRDNERTKNVKSIGTVVDEHHTQVVIKTLIGGKRMVNMLPGDQLPRIC